MKKSKNIRIYAKPLKTSGSIEIVGSVPCVQIYQADRNEYTPDYAITPLTLFPRCNATDPSSTSSTSDVNEKLTNMKWYEVTGGVKKLIESTNEHYSIVTEGKEKGKIQVKKNVSTTQPITLEFHAEYVDTSIKGGMYLFRYNKLIRSVDGSEAAPTLCIDSPSGGLDWNPIRDVNNQTITASLFVGDRELSSSERVRIFWYRVLPTNGALEAITDGNGENDFEIVSVSGNKLTINRDMIGHQQTYVCKASYAQTGSPADVPDDVINYVSTTIRRRIPNIEIDWSGVPREVPAGTSYIYPKPIIRDTLGDVPTPEKYFRCTWYDEESTGKLKLLGYGFNPKIPYKNNLRLLLDVQDIGPTCLVVQTLDDGTVKIVKSNGKYVTEKKLQP